MKQETARAGNTGKQMLPFFRSAYCCVVEVSRCFPAVYAHHPEEYSRVTSSVCTPYKVAVNFFPQRGRLKQQKRVRCGTFGPFIFSHSPRGLSVILSDEPPVNAGERSRETAGKRFRFFACLPLSAPGDICVALPS